MAFQNMGTMPLGCFGAKTGTPMTLDAAGISSGQAFLVSELEKRDTLLRTPLESHTWSRDIDVEVGGGWDEFVSALNVDFGVTGGSSDGLINAPGADGIPMVQANFGKDLFKTHIVALGSRIQWVDMQRGNMTGRNLDTVTRDGVRLAYEKHMDANTYVGFSKIGTTGIVNNSGVAASTVATGAGGYTAWSTKTADEILADINGAISDAWEAAEYDLDAIPNHILIPYAQLSLISSAKVSNDASKSILEYVLENNIAKLNGVDLFIGATAYCKGAGTGTTDRMVVYCRKRRFLKMDELAPLTRAMTTPNTENFCYDTAYAANVSEAEIFYTETMIYADGI